MPSEFLRRIALAARILRGGKLPTASWREEVPPITAEEVAEAKQFFPREKFFIFGHARSGTTLLARLVRVHPDVHCNWQAHFFTRSPLLKRMVADPEVGGWLARKSNRWNRGRDLSPVVLRAAGDFILERDARRVGKNIVGDKSPNSLLDGEAVRLLHNVYPDARLIFIIRDGRDATLSHRFQAFIDGPHLLPKVDFRIREAFIQDPKPFLQGKRSIFTARGIRQAAEGWMSNVVETDLAGKELFGEQYISLRYEDLLERPWQEMNRVWACIGADLQAPGLKGALESELQQNPDADWQQQKAGEIAQTLQKGKRGAWQEMFTPYDREVFQEIAGETLQAWGYTIA